LNTHIAFAGRVPHWKVKVSCDPLSGAMEIVKSAVSPLETDTEVDPTEPSVKSRPVPVSDTAALAEAVLLVMVRLPVFAPEAAGANTTPTVQLAPAPSVGAHVLFTMLNPVVVANARLLRPNAVGLVTVTTIALLLVPTPTSPKLKVAGVA
jgi:hypothetical protein